MNSANVLNKEPCKDSEDARAGEIRYRETLDKLMEGCQIIGFDWRYLYINDSATMQGNQCKEDLLGHTMMERYPGIENTEMFAVLKRCMVDRTSQKIENEFSFPDGNKGVFNLSIQPVPEGIFILSMDITASKRAEEALRESEDKFKYVFENSTLGKSIALPSGELQVNNALCDLLGYSAEELRNIKWQDISHPDDIDLTQQALEPILSGEKDSVRFIKRYVHKNGSIVWVDVGTSLRRDKEGKPLYFMTSVSDITERKQAEEQLRRLNEELEQRVLERTAQLETSNRELEAFSYSVSHDLRAPLRHIRGYVDLLMKRFPALLPEKANHYLDTIADSAQHMEELIDDLLQFSKAVRQEMKWADLDMNIVLHDELNRIKQDIDERNIEWDIATLPHVDGDEKLLPLVWANLLSNAVKFTQKNDKARIEIGVKEEADEVVFFVRDNGVGFDMNYVHKLFGVFQRLHSSREFEGTGIGLANVRRIIQRHGGRTWAESELNNGATLYFTLPAKKEI
jgi:PAS domain S-box-containing protein